MVRRTSLRYARSSARRAYAKRIDRLDPERYSTVNEPGREAQLAACIELLIPEG
jgi:hypothetical protein